MSLATETQVTELGGGAVREPLTPAELAPHFPQLEILECLGRGGMGVVYKARQKTLNRIVALKLLAPERVTDAGFAERFTREAQALARLNHPNIVTIHDFGCTRAGDLQSPPFSTLNPQLSTSSSGFYFLLMEFVDGVNLRQAMRAGRFTPEQALLIVPPVCEALHYAHGQGIVHRDIKPENLLLDKAGRVKIADFGIAKMLEHGRAELPLGHSTEAAQQRGPTSQESFVAGTPQYMAPEQRADPQHADHRADIYSLGVVLYEMLTGELPGKELQPPSKRVQVDVRIDEIVLRALEAKPDLRFATAAEFRTQVETATREVRTGKADAGHPLFFRSEGGLRLGWPGVLELCGTLGLVVLGLNLVIAFGIWLVTRQPWPMFKPQELPWVLVLMAVCLVMRLATRRMKASPTATTTPSQKGAAPAEPAGASTAGTTWQSPTSGWGHFVGYLFGLRFTSPLAFKLANLSALGFLCFLSFAPFPGAKGFLGFSGFFGLIGVAFMVEMAKHWQAQGPRRSGLALLLTAIAAFGLALIVGFLLLAGLYRTREATMVAQPAALAAKQQARDALGSQDPSIVAPQTNAATTSPITSSIVADDDSPTAIAAAQQRGIASATRDFQAGIFRILRYGSLMKTDGTETDQETGFRIQWVAGSIIGDQFRAEADAYNFAMRDRYWKHEHWQRKAATTPPVAAGDDSKLNAIARTFPLRHKLASDMGDDLRQILLGRPGHEAKPSANNQEILVTAPPEVLTRAQTFITVTDWPDTITRGSNYEYPRQTVLRAARSFFYACALEDATEAISKLLSLHVLAQLKGDTKSSHYENYSIGGVPDPEWEKSLRADWPGKQEAIQRLVREWNLYPLKRLTEESGIAIGFGVKHFCSVAFEGAPKEFYQVTIEPDRTKPRGADGATFYFSSLPPWWKDAPATNATAMDFRVLKVEAPPGLRDIRVHFQCAAPAGFGFEVCQDVTRGPYGETPKSKDAFWLRTKWVGLTDPPVLVWTLPEDFTPAEVQAAAKQVEAHLRTMRDALRMLPTEAVSSFGKVRHREGWLYELVLRVKLARDHSPVQAADAWVVEGTVRDGEGKPVPEADIHVSSGAGSLFVTGKGKTGADGTYRVGFGPGISMSAGDRRGAMQAAIVHVGKAGFEEKELGAVGDLKMAWELTPQQLTGGWQPGPQKTFLPGKPLRVDFVLLPAATVRGTLLTPDGKPVPSREIVLIGERLRPASSIYASAKTDAGGRFTFKDVSTQHAWSFSIEKTPHHRKRTAPDRFAEPRVYDVTLIADGDDLRRGEVPVKPKGEAGANLPAAPRVATGEGKYELASGVTLVITARPLRGAGVKHFDGRLDWPKSATNPKAVSFDVALSEGAPFAVGWRADGHVLWVACGGGDGTDNSIRYVRKLTIAGPGNVDEQSWDAREKQDFGGLPAELRRVFDTFIAPSPATNRASALEDELIRLAQQRLQQIRLQQEVGRAGLLDVIEAEGVLAVAEARSNALKQAEARLITATTALELIEKLHLAGRSDVETAIQAKQRKLAAELEIQRLRAGSPAPPAKP